MIYTVTFNPSLDYIISVDHFTLACVNRTSKERILPGGKGINVSIVLKNLGMESTALGFLAGFTGEEIKRLVKEYQICTEFIEVQNGISRINVKLRSEQESEINGMGPDIDADSLNSFLQRLNCLKEGDVLVLAGSIPSSLPVTIYRDIFGLDDLTEKIPVAEYAKKLQKMGARNVLVSMAGEGAVLVTEDGQVFMSGAPEGKVKNSVGAGDSMVAGFLYGYFTTGSYEEAFRYGVCAGSASAFSENLATREEIMELFKKW